MTQHENRSDEKLPTLLSSAECANYIRGSQGSLAKMRLTGSGPAFLRLSPRKIVYRQSDVDAWLDERKHGSTAEYV